MKSKKIGVSLIVLVVLAAAFVAFGLPYIERHFDEVAVEQIDQGKSEAGSSNIMTVYFTRVGNTDFEDGIDAVASASLMKSGDELKGNSQHIAEVINAELGGDIYAITTEKKYPSSYGDTVDLAKNELDNGTEVKLSGELPDMAKYKKVYLVIPIWWGTIPGAVGEFLKQTDMSGADIYTVVTHGGSKEGQCIEAIKELTEGGVSDETLAIYDKDAYRCSDDIKSWLKSVDHD